MCNLGEIEISRFYFLHKCDAIKWTYTISISATMIAKNVAEHRIVARTIVETPKYNRGDKVRFITEEPSYDIWVKGNPGCLYKHIRESMVIGPVE